MRILAKWRKQHIQAIIQKMYAYYADEMQIIYMELVKRAKQIQRWQITANMKILFVLPEMDLFGVWASQEFNFWHVHRLSRIFYKSLLKSKNFCWLETKRCRWNHITQLLQLSLTWERILANANGYSFTQHLSKIWILSPWNSFKLNWTINIEIGSGDKIRWAPSNWSINLHLE